jgi:hypothetical protein
VLASPLPGIEDLREKREEVNRQILQEEEEKAKIQKDLSILTDRLSKINESLARKVQARNEYDKTIQETEAAYMKVCSIPKRSHTDTLIPYQTLPHQTLPHRTPTVPVFPASMPNTHPCRTLADLGEFADASPRPQARDCKPYQEEAVVFLIGFHGCLRLDISRAPSTST